MSNIIKNNIHYEAVSGRLKGSDIVKIERKLKDISSIFENQEALKSMDLEQVAYEVESYLPVPEGTEGGLFFGTSYLYPGKVGNEYFMTKGHFHSKIDTAEFYWCLTGEGILLLMDAEGNVTAEKMQKGSIHYIPGKIAHRIANTGNELLTIGACWPSDAGHDYQTIAETGFSVRVLDVDGNVEISIS